VCNYRKLHITTREQLWQYSLLLLTKPYLICGQMEFEGESHGWMDLGFNSILSMQVASKDNGVYKGDYAFRMNVMEEILRLEVV